MRSFRQSVSVALGCMVGCSLIGSLTLVTMAMPVTCPEGETPAPFVQLATVDLPPDLPAGSAVQVTRLTVAPGADIVASFTPHTAYIVVSGVLEFQQPLRGGFYMEYPALCQPENGVYSGGGVEEADADGWMQVNAGSTLVADEVVIEELRNAGSEPLELLVVTVSVPEIDPATGKPVKTSRVDRGNDDRTKERRERKAQATPTP